MWSWRQAGPSVELFLPELETGKSGQQPYLGFNQSLRASKKMEPPPALEGPSRPGKSPGTCRDRTLSSGR